MTATSLVFHRDIDRSFDPMTAVCYLETAHVILKAIWPESELIPGENSYEICGIVDRQVHDIDCLRIVVGHWMKTTDFGDEVAVKFARRELVVAWLAARGLKLNSKGVS
jgi:hypothetical protein